MMLSRSIEADRAARRTGGLGTVVERPFARIDAREPVTG
jgi:hypothetical protein